MVWSETVNVSHFNSLSVGVPDSTRGTSSSLHPLEWWPKPKETSGGWFPHMPTLFWISESSRFCLKFLSSCFSCVLVRHYRESQSMLDFQIGLIGIALIGLIFLWNTCNYMNFEDSRDLLQHLKIYSLKALNQSVVAPSTILCRIVSSFKIGIKVYLKKKI